MLGHVRIDAGELRPALDALEGARQRPDWPPAPELEAEVLVAISRAHMRLNDVSDALEAAEQALEIAGRATSSIVADAMNNKAATLSNHGRRRKPVALQKEAVAMAVEGGWTDLELVAQQSGGQHRRR